MGGFLGDGRVHPLRRADGYGALVHHHRVLVHRAADVAGDRQDVLQIGRPVLFFRSAHGDEHDVGGAHRRRQIGGELDPFLGKTAANHLLEAGLVDRHPALFEHGDLGGVLVDANDVVSVFRETRTKHKTDIAGSNDSDFHFTIRY